MLDSIIKFVLLFSQHYQLIIIIWLINRSVIFSLLVKSWLVVCFAGRSTTLSVVKKSLWQIEDGPPNSDRHDIQDHTPRLQCNGSYSCTWLRPMRKKIKPWPTDYQLRYKVIFKPITDTIRMQPALVNGWVWNGTWEFAVLLQILECPFYNIKTIIRKWYTGARQVISPVSQVSRLEVVASWCLPAKYSMRLDNRKIVLRWRVDGDSKSPIVHWCCQHSSL
jgi:hypothetical protein